MSKATLKTIAKHTGFSVTTVSRALKDGDDVKQPTKDIVKAAAKELGYRPNPSGVGLRTGINYNICAILPVTKPGDIAGDIGTLRLIEGFATALKDSPYQLTVLPVQPGENSLDQIKYAVENGLCGGVIFNMTETKDERVLYLTEKNMPFITFGQTEMSVQHAFVDIDNYDAIYNAVTYLIKRGRKNIRLISGSEVYTYVWHKYYGAKRAAMENGVNFDFNDNTINEAEVDNYRDLGKSIALSTLNNAEPIDAIICSSEINASGIIAGIQDGGKKVNQDIDVVVIETCDLPSYFIPPVSGYRQDFSKIGKTLIEFLIKRINGTPAEDLQIIYKTQFHERC